MNRQQNPKDVVDEAARARKLLAKNVPQRLSGLVKTNVTLQQGATQQLGDHIVVAIVTPNQSHQFVISRPIGVTDLSEDAWVVNRVDHIASMLTRREDPGKGALNQHRAQLRTALAVQAGLLVEDNVTGRTVYFYPDRVDASRNDLLEEARNQQKTKRQELEALKADAKTPQQKSQIAIELGKTTDVTHFMDGATAAAEGALRSFWSSAEVEELINDQYPQTFRTLTGPFGDMPQYSIAGAEGKTLDTVANGVAKSISMLTFEIPTRRGNHEEEDSPTEAPHSGALAEESNRQDLLKRVARRAEQLKTAHHAAGAPPVTGEEPKPTPPKPEAPVKEASPPEPQETAELEKKGKTTKG